MIAFGHTIKGDIFDNEVNTTSTQAEIYFQKSHKPIETLQYKQEYDQNQNRDVTLSSSSLFNHNHPAQEWTFEVKSVVHFYWQEGSNKILYQTYKDGNSELIKYWFLHTLLPIYLTIENKFELIHAGGVEINNKPVLFIAPSYGGKSTLTNHFIQQGHTMISDDRVPLKEVGTDIFVTSSYNYHRPYRRMEDLGVKVDNFLLERKKLHKVYVLTAGEATEKVAFKQLKGVDTFAALQYNFDFILPLNKARSFELIAKIAAQVPIYQVTIPWDLARLTEVYNAICKHN